ncbi:potassium channel subfamily T member 2-like isoform X2 [Pomacea canaliculata]|uniref:potassium channel subfamily T member 2-like isoform X2 n=1 Tax=Pomacea canaliculata TaxID=400727 RepID=UPI000D726372|nr:potassium channel subfamily T member 2-like isoform X2 [Pomacea canaliculata]
MQQADCDGIDLQWMYHGSSDEETDDAGDGDRDGVPVKFFTHELSLRGRLRRFFIRNPTTRIYNTVFDLAAKSILCLLYVVRVCLDDHKLYACHGSQCLANVTDTENKGFTSTNVNWHVILWIHRPLPLWVLETLLCTITFTKACLYASTANKGKILDYFLTHDFLLELLCSLPMIATLCYPMYLSNLFVPLFLNCWLARVALRRLLNDLHLTKQRFQTLSVTLSQQVWFLTVTLCCLVFTTICGIQHIQRSSSERPLTIFESVYYVIVTFSTVGYGDISPDIWLGQLFMIVMICVAFAFIPKQLEEIGSSWSQRKKTGGDYGKRKSARSKHIVVSATSFTSEVVMNFLNEFYEHPKLEDHTVILMSSEELDTNMLFILKDPKWANRVLYIRGSPLKDIDLKRCRINDAEAIFFLVNKNCRDRDHADQHTVLRSWAVKDFAPNCRQYIQLFSSANKMHVKFAEHVVCEDEFKYALLANNCLYPGLSTLVTLILHTSRGKEGQMASEVWQQIYGRHSGNEIYHIQLSRSIFFHKYEGQRFTQASAAVHQSFGVSLIAVLDMTEAEPRLKLNPGSDYILKGTDYCFYMSLTKEEYSRVTRPLDEEPSQMSEERRKNIERLTLQLQQWLQSDNEVDEDDDEESVFSTITSNMGNTLSRRMRGDLEALPLLNARTSQSTGIQSELNSLPEEGGADIVDRMYENTSDRVFQQFGDVGQESFSFVTGPLPCTIHVGSRRIICHLHRQPRALCCLKWGEDCEHCGFKKASDDRWNNQLIIVSIQEVSPAVYNFIVPLRSSYLSLGSLSPIILMLHQEPDDLFMETIAHFPLVYWMVGSLHSLDDLLRAGVNKALHLVISHIQGVGVGEEESLDDAETIVTVQKISRLFPNVNIITEVHEASNMRFMHFQARDTYTQEIARLEKRLKEKTTSNLPYLFRLPFAAGQVFSSTMLDRLLYQTFVKGYLISFVRLLLGIDAQENSGHLSSVRVKRATINQFPTYGDLYQGLCSTTGEIPIAIYRTERRAGHSMEALAAAAENNNRSFMKGRPSMPSGIFHRAERDHLNLSDLVNARLKRLHLAGEEPYVIKKPPKTLSYVIVNPSPKRKLKSGDMIYVIQPSAMVAVPNKLRWRSSMRRNAAHVHRPSSDPSPLEKENGTSSSGTRIKWNIGPHSPVSVRKSPQSKTASDRHRSKSESSAEKKKAEELLMHNL